MKGLICLFSRPYLLLPVPSPPPHVGSELLSLPKGTSTGFQITDGKEDLTRAAFVPLMADLPSGLGAITVGMARRHFSEMYREQVAEEQVFFLSSYLSSKRMDKTLRLGARET
ncbi:unnamed protein product [Nezara viridula]|uniref:Uncharacterized protein n=1 Tax=Nezara viridula TaxID=85310 RepID=A0A9P0HKZ5_NEZVI|nr:unnamed protein product [Nezara viridula]